MKLLIIHGPNMNLIGLWSSKNHSNIQSVATKTLDENFTELTAKLVVKDTDHLELIKSQLKNNKTVTNIERQQT